MDGSWGRHARARVSRTRYTDTRSCTYRWDGVIILLLERLAPSSRPYHKFSLVSWPSSNSSYRPLDRTIAAPRPPLAIDLRPRTVPRRRRRRRRRRRFVRPCLERLSIQTPEKGSVFFVRSLIIESGDTWSMDA